MESKRSIREDNLASLVNRGLPVTGALELQQVARSLHRLDELSCNYDLTERQERKEERLTEDAVHIAAQGGLLIYRQGDPRGWPLYIYKQVDLDALNQRSTRTNRPYSIDSVYSSVGEAVCPF